MIKPEDLKLLAERMGKKHVRVEDGLVTFSTGNYYASEQTGGLLHVTAEYAPHKNAEQAGELIEKFGLINSMTEVLVCPVTRECFCAERQDWKEAVTLAAIEEAKMVSLDDLKELAEKGQDEDAFVLAVRLRTDYWHNERGGYLKKSILPLKRLTTGFNFLEHEMYESGAENVLPRIKNLMEMPDGVYELVIINESRDRETGIVEDCDFMLVRYEKDKRQSSEQ